MFPDKYPANNGMPFIVCFLANWFCLGGHTCYLVFIFFLYYLACGYCITSFLDNIEPFLFCRDNMAILSSSITAEFFQLCFIFVIECSYEIHVTWKNSLIVLYFLFLVTSLTDIILWNAEKTAGYGGQQRWNKSILFPWPAVSLFDIELFSICMLKSLCFKYWDWFCLQVHWQKKKRYSSF